MRTYQIIRVLGSGSFGSVYEAKVSGDNNFSRTVAVKVLRWVEGVEAEELCARFRDEARVAASLQHPGIAPATWLTTIDGAPCIVMDLVQGPPLNRLSITPPPRAAVEMVSQVAEALDYAHRRGVIHRDIKPANLALHAGRVKILDFGIAKTVGEYREAATAPHCVIGSPRYMSPECLVGTPASAAADIYALGVTLYELCMGVPFGTARLSPDDHSILLERQANLLAKYDPSLASLMQWMCVHDPAARPSARSLIEWCEDASTKLPGPTLRRWAEQIPAPRTKMADDALVGRMITEETSSYNIAATPRPTRALLGVSMVGLAGLGVVLMVAVGFATMGVVTRPAATVTAKSPSWLR